MEDSFAITRPEDIGLVLQQIYKCRKEITRIRHLLNDKTDVIKSFARRCDERCFIAPSSEVVVYLTDIQDHVLTMMSNLTHLEQMLSEELGKGILDRLRISLEELRVRFEEAGNQEGRFLSLAVAKDMQDMETGERGYLVTGREELLEPYGQGQRLLETHLRELHRVSASAYHEDVAAIEEMAANWIEKSAVPEISIRTVINEAKKMEDVIALLTLGTGKALMDRMRGVLAEFVAHEQRLLAESYEP